MLAAEATRRDLEAREELVQVPAQPALDARPFRDEIVAMVSQEAQLTRLPIQLCHREVGLPEGSSGDGQSIDRVGLAPLAAAPPSPSHKPGRDAYDGLAGPKEVGLKSPGNMPAVFQGKDPLWPRLNPRHGLQVPFRRCRHRALAQLAARLVDGNECVRALVRIDPSITMPVLPPRFVLSRRDRWWTCLHRGFDQAPIKSLRPVPACLEGGASRRSHS